MALFKNRVFAILVVLSVIFVTIPVFAANQDPFIPKWFLNVYQYLKDEQITAKEFEDALAYMQKVGMVRLLDSQDGPITNFLMTSAIIEQNATGRSEFTDCSPEWYITGYFTPLESDYTGKFITVSIDNISYKFREGFVTEIITEGWGKTTSGKYLGWYDDSFHLSDFPLNVSGSSLEGYAIAVDPSTIPPNSRVTIPTLVSPWDDVVFFASDVGTAIVGKHIDVYTGEGKKALDEAYRITGHGNVVCLEAK